MIPVHTIINNIEIIVYHRVSVLKRNKIENILIAGVLSFSIQAFSVGVKFLDEHGLPRSHDIGVLAPKLLKDRALEVSHTQSSIEVVFN